MKIRFVFTFLLLVNYIFSQVDSSKAVVFIKPQDAIVYLDGKKIVPKQELIKMSVGYHKIKAWAPKYELFSDSFLVKKKENKFYSKKLRLTDDYRAYRAKKRIRILTYTLPAILAGGFASMYYKGYQDYDKRISQNYSEVIELEGLYNNSFSPAEFESNYNDYYQKVSDYKDLQEQQKKYKTQGIIVTSALAATAITAFVIQLVRKKTPYTETPLLSRISPSFNPINKQLCLTVNLY